MRFLYNSILPSFHLVNNLVLFHISHVNYSIYSNQANSNPSILHAILIWIFLVWTDYLKHILDEVQYITITGCNSVLTTSSRTLVLNMVDHLSALRNITLLCDASDAIIRSTILAATSIDVHVAVKTVSGAGESSVRQVTLSCTSLCLVIPGWDEYEHAVHYCTGLYCSACQSIRLSICLLHEIS